MADPNDTDPCLDYMDYADLVSLWRYINDVNLTSTSNSSPTSRYGISFAVIIVVSSIAVVVNVSLLLAIGQVKRVNAYLRLVVSLSVSDILVGIRVLFSSLDIRPFTDSDLELCAFVYLRGLRMTSHLISLFNLLGLGLDHYCAILQPITYRSHMSASRANIMIASFWIVSFLCGYSDFFVPAPAYSYCYQNDDYASDDPGLCTPDIQNDLLKLLNKTTMNESFELKQYDTMTSSQNWSASGNASVLPDYDDLAYFDPEAYGDLALTAIEKEGFCYSVMCSRYDPEYLVLLLAALLLLAMSFIYARVCVQIYSMRRMFRGGDSSLGGGRSGRAFRRNKKGLVTTLCIVGTFMVCWLPFCLFTGITVVKMALYPESSEDYYGLSVKVDKYLYALLILNSLCDPAIYALRMRDVQIGYRRLIRKWFSGYKADAVNGERFSSSYQMTSHYSPSESRYGRPPAGRASSRFTPQRDWSISRSKVDNGVSACRGFMVCDPERKPERVTDNI